MFTAHSLVLLALGLDTVVATAPSEIIRDVAIIGGGASGTYAAVRLREDLHKSIVIVETRPNLGGHTSTYRVPGTNASVDYGVQSYLPYGPATDFFARFGIATEPFAGQRLTPINVDVKTGKLLAGYTAPSANATNGAFARWLTITQKYQQYLEPGYWDFPAPNAIPADFLMPFEEFAQKNNIEAAVPRIVTISGVGYGGVRELLTLTVFQAFGAALTKDLLSGTLFHPVPNNSLLYERALSLLSSDVLLSSTVTKTVRTPDHFILSVAQGGSGKKYTIKARRILFTAPPTPKNLAPFHPDAKEASAVAKWPQGAEFVGIIKAKCLPEKTSITHLPSAVVPSKQLKIKDWPYSLRLDSTGPAGESLFRVVFGANYTVSAEGLKELVRKSVGDVLREGAVGNATADPAHCDVDFKAVSDHTRPWWPQSAEELRKGFVQDLYSLQGYRNIWYTGYAWGAQYSSTVWAFTDTVLKRMLTDLDRQ
ncbi:hypothetical protein ACJQWK_05621 [Exserohilum turcicum]